MKYLENTRKAIQNYESESKKHRSIARMSKRQQRKTAITSQDKKKRDKSRKE